MQPRLLAWALFIAVAASQMGGQSTSARPASAVSMDQDFGKVPLTFEANSGQANAQVKFLSRGKGYTAFLMSGGMVLSLHPSASGSESAALQADRGPSRPAASVQLKLVGASKNPAVVGEDLQPGKVNYFIGNDPAKWKTNISTYGRVRYKNVYPGIDVLYYGNHRQLEYDFEIQAGADPRQIQFEVAGADQLDLDAQGDLLLTLGNQQLRLQSPTVYQQSNSRRIPVNGSYVLTGSKHVTFQLAGYDQNRPLVIDPVLVYSTYLGGTGDDSATGIAVDAAGNVYVAGHSDSVDFPLTSLGSVALNTTHAFVAKLDSTGTNLVYADYLGGNNYDSGSALVLDGANNVYVTGTTSSSNFPTVNPYQATMPGPYTGFLSKISADGSHLAYSTYIGGNSWDDPTSIALDPLGDVYVAGATQSLNFPAVNAYQPTVSANQGGMYGIYGFLSKFNPNGSSLVYSTYLGGSSNVVQQCWNGPCWPIPYNILLGVAVDANGNAYVTGNTNAYDFPVTNGAYLTSDSTPNDTIVSFVSKFGSSGTLAYSTYFYGASGASTTGIAVDSGGSAYVTGFGLSDGTFPITSTSICDPNVYGQACGYAFVTKFNPTASTLQYSTFLGPNNFAAPTAIALDATNNAYILASTSTGSFSSVNGIEAFTSGSHILLVEIDASATSELFATYLGGSGTELPAALAVDSNDDVYIAGSTNSGDFPVTTTAFQNLPGGNNDAFVLKIAPSSAPAFTASPASVQFAAQAVGTTSPVQTILLRNMGSSSLSISSISVSGDFSQTNDCGTSVAPAGNCTFSVTFTPTAEGQRSGSILVQDNAAGSPHAVNLGGDGLSAIAALTPSSLSFANTPVGTSSAAQTVTLANSGNATLNIGSIQIAGDYTQTNTCTGSLAPGSSCAVSVIFQPTATGIRTGSLTVSDSVQSSPQILPLTGTGVDFSLAASASSTSVKAGGTATYTITVAPIGGAFVNAITMSCSGAPALTTCSASPISVTPGANPATVTVTIKTTAPSDELALSQPAQTRHLSALFMQLPGFGLFGMILAGPRSWRKKIPVLIVLLALIAGLMFMAACAGGTGIAKQQPGTATGTYTITVKGASGTLQHSIPLTLTVN